MFTLTMTDRQAEAIRQALDQFVANTEPELPADGDPVENAPEMRRLLDAFEDAEHLLEVFNGRIAALADTQPVPRPPTVRRPLIERELVSYKGLNARLGKIETTKAWIQMTHSGETMLVPLADLTPVYDDPYTTVPRP